MLSLKCQTESNSTAIPIMDGRAFLPSVQRRRGDDEDACKKHSQRNLNNESNKAHDTKHTMLMHSPRRAQVMSALNCAKSSSFASLDSMMTLICVSKNRQVTLKQRSKHRSHKTKSLTSSIVNGTAEASSACLSASMLTDPDPDGSNDKKASLMAWYSRMSLA
jgi:hypothetical protein